MLLKLTVALASAAWVAWVPWTACAGAAAEWDWPGDGAVPPAVTRAFDPPAARWLAGHRGVDLAMSAGAAVVAPADGVVVWAGELAGRSVVSVEVSARGPLRTTLEPVSPLPHVAVGTRVSRGEVIGIADAGHPPAGSGVHWGVRVGRDHYVNPLRMLAGPVGLKPWGAGPGAGS